MDWLPCSYSTKYSDDCFVRYGTALVRSPYVHSLVKGVICLSCKLLRISILPFIVLGKNIYSGSMSFVLRTE